MRPQREMRPRGQSLAIVIFGPSSLRYLRYLKPGYRHCLVAVQGAGQWHLLDPLSNGLELTVLGELRVDEIISGFGRDGYEAIAVQRQAPVMRELPLAPFTCVEVVKRVLGIRARHILTPWQLRRYLQRNITYSSNV